MASHLTANGASPVAQILDGMPAAAFPFVVSEALLTEYRAVLIGPKLCKLLGLAVAGVDGIQTDLAQHAIVQNPLPSAASPAPDPGGQWRWDLLAAREDLMLVTGDQLLLQDSGMRRRVVAPQLFVAGIDMRR